MIPHCFNPLLTEVGLQPAILSVIEQESLLFQSSFD